MKIRKSSNYEYEINFDNNSYSLSFSINSNELVIKAQDNNSAFIFPQIYEGKFSLENLIDQMKYFKICDSIGEVPHYLDTILIQGENKIYSDMNALYLSLSFPPLIKEESTFTLLIIAPQDIDITKHLITAITKMNKEIIELREENNKFKEEISKIKKCIYTTEPVEKVNFFQESTIINKQEERDQLINWIFDNQEFNGKTQLIYTSTLHGGNADYFHYYCDGKSPTVILIKSNKGARFGGYTEAPWEKNYKYKTDKNAFLFSLDNLKMFRVTESKHAILCDSYGPTFGRSYSYSDLYICQNFLEENSYKGPQTSYKKCSEDELTGGEKCFVVKELEVFQIIS